MLSPPSTWQNSDQQVLVGKQRSVLFPLNIVKITAKLCWHLSLCYLHWPPRLCSAVVGFISFCCAPSVVTSYWRPAIMLLVPGETSPTNSLPHCSHQHLQHQPLSTTIRMKSTFTLSSVAESAFLAAVGLFQWLGGSPRLITVVWCGTVTPLTRGTFRKPYACSFQSRQNNYFFNCKLLSVVVFWKLNDRFNTLKPDST